MLTDSAANVRCDATGRDGLAADLAQRADDRWYFAEQAISECDAMLVVRRERRPVGFLAVRGDTVEHL
jgi:hypothetical protein